MKIKNIEFDEKSLASFMLNRDAYNSVSKSDNVIWFLTLNLQIRDDFNFKVNESKIVQYDEFDFKGIDELDHYIEWLRMELNAIVNNNQSK